MRRQSSERQAVDSRRFAAAGVVHGTDAVAVAVARAGGGNCDSVR